MGLTNLRVLNLSVRSENAITDAGLAHIAGFTKLKVLDLFGTHATDAGLVHLRGMTRLRSLDLRSTRVSSEAAEELQKRMPKAKIRHEALPEW
jgi:hypothetical protein